MFRERAEHQPAVLICFKKLEPKKDLIDNEVFFEIILL